MVSENPRSPVRIGLRNLILIAVVALPLIVAFAALQMQFLLPGIEQHRPTQDDFFGWVFVYAILLPRVILGGALHQALLVAIPSGWSHPWQRTAIVLSALLIALAFPSELFFPEFIPSVLAGLLIYGFLARPLRMRG